MTLATELFQACKHLFVLYKIYSRSLPESKSLGERDRDGALEFTALEVFAFGIWV